jgi:hypothetical protein
MRIKKIFEYQKDKLWEYDDWSYDIDREEATFIIQNENGTTFEPLNFNDTEINKIRSCVSLFDLPNFNFEVKSGPIELVDGPKYKKEIKITILSGPLNHIMRVIIIFKVDDDYFFIDDTEEDGYKCDTIDGVIQLLETLFDEYGTITKSEAKFRELKLTITNYIENSTIKDVENMSKIVKIIEGK